MIFWHSLRAAGSILISSLAENSEYGNSSNPPPILYTPTLRDDRSTTRINPPRPVTPCLNPADTPGMTTAAPSTVAAAATAATVAVVPVAPGSSAAAMTAVTPSTSTTQAAANVTASAESIRVERDASLVGLLSLPGSAPGRNMRLERLLESMETRRSSSNSTSSNGGGDSSSSSNNGSSTVQANGTQITEPAGRLVSGECVL